MIKDCDCIINYHPGEANVVADVLCRKEELNGLIMSKKLRKEMNKLELEFKDSSPGKEKLFQILVQTELIIIF